MDEAIYNELREAINGLLEITTRVDERIKILVEKLHETDEHIKTLFRNNSDTLTRLGILENNCNGSLKEDIHELRSNGSDLSNEINSIDKRLLHLEGKNLVAEDRWKKVFGFIYQSVTTLFICYLLYRLNLSTPPLP